LRNAFPLTDSAQRSWIALNEHRTDKMTMRQVLGGVSKHRNAKAAAKHHARL